MRTYAAQTTWLPCARDYLRIFFFTWRTPFTFQNMAEKQQKGTEAAEETKNI